MSLRDWSKVPSSNATVGAINYAENQPANTLNDSARTAMADVAQWRDDIEGVLTTTGAANSYSLTTNQTIVTLANGTLLGAKINAANTGASTLSVDATGSRAIRKMVASGDAALAAGELVTGGRYLFQYDTAANAGAGAWIVLNPCPDPAVTAAVTNLPNGSVTYAKIQNVSAGRVLGRRTGSAGPVEELPIAVDVNNNVGIGITTNLTSRLNIGSAGIASFTGSTPGAMTLIDTSVVVNNFTNLDFTAAGNVLPVARVGMQYTPAGSFLNFGVSNSFVTGITLNALTIAPWGGVAFSGSYGTAGQVLTSGGPSAAPTWGNPPVAPDIIIEDQKASGTAGGTSVSSSWNARTLNTVVRNAVAGASLASNLLTLPAGTYYARWSCPAAAIGGHKSRLRNTTTSTDLAYGSSEHAGGGVAVTTHSNGTFYFTLSASSALGLDTYTSGAFATNGLGYAASAGVTEIYSRLEIWRVA